MDAGQSWVRRKSPLQLVPKFAGEQQAVKRGTVGELLRQPGNRAIGAVGVENHVIGVGQSIHQIADLGGIAIWVICRERPYPEPA